MTVVRCGRVLVSRDIVITCVMSDETNDGFSVTGSLEDMLFKVLRAKLGRR